MMTDRLFGFLSVGSQQKNKQEYQNKPFYIFVC